MRSAGLVELCEVESDRFERPPGRTISAGHARPYVLMEIDEDIQAVVARAPANLREIVEIVSVVAARIRVLDRFPSREQAQAVEAPVPQAMKVLVGFPQRKRPADERYGAMVREIIRMAGAAVRKRNLAVTAEIYAAQHDLAILAVEETIADDPQRR